MSRADDPFSEFTTRRRSDGDRLGRAAVPALRRRPAVAGGRSPRPHAGWIGSAVRGRPLRRVRAALHESPAGPGHDRPVLSTGHRVRSNPRSPGRIGDPDRRSGARPRPVGFAGRSPPTARPRRAAHRLGPKHRKRHLPRLWGGVGRIRSAAALDALHAGDTSANAGAGRVSGDKLEDGSSSRVGDDLGPHGDPRRPGDFAATGAERGRRSRRWLRSRPALPVAAMQSSRSRRRYRTLLRSVAKRPAYHDGMNRLASESSLYLRQHADNPVDWYPWGPEALDRAKRENKPIFLSIGYSACHWCHVMEHESFEDAEIAPLLNEHFVSIKVDREERPDLDQIYMTAVQALTGPGRLADVGLPHAGPAAVLRRHLLPAATTATAGRASAACCRRWPRPGETAATRSSKSAGQITERAPAAPASRPRPRASSTDGLLRDRRRSCCGGRSTRATAASARPRSSRTPIDLRLLLRVLAPLRRRRRPGRWSADARPAWPRAASTTTSAAASTATAPTSAGWCRTSRRCSTTTPC